MGEASEGALGVRTALGLEDDRVFGIKLKPDLLVEALEAEWLTHGSAEDIANFEYVHGGVALDDSCVPAHVKKCIAEGRYHSGSLAPGEFDEGNAGKTLQDFAGLAISRQAQLSLVEVLAVRLYPTSSFPLYNRPLRSRSKPHPIAMTVYHLDQALKKLRSAAATIDPEGYLQTIFLYRGMKNMRLDWDRFRAVGGTELAPMSTTVHKDVALAYASSEHPIMFKYRTQANSRGVSIQYLSVFPKEQEYLYPPGTFLLPDGAPVPDDEDPSVTVYHVLPQMS